MSKLLKISLFIILFSLPARLAGGATPPALTGQARDVRGYVLEGLTITARNASTGAEQETTSDANGVFTYQSLEPGRYILSAQTVGVERMLSAVKVEAGKTCEVELLALPLRDTGNTAVDKHIASSEDQGGRYPAGNI